LAKTNILLHGSKYHINLIKSILKKNINIDIYTNSQKINKIDYVFSIGCFPYFLLMNFSFWFKNTPKIIIQWTGTDVLYFTSPKTPINWIKKIIIKNMQKIRSKKIINITVSKWLKDELKTEGIPTYYFPRTTIDNRKLLPLDETQKKSIDFLSYVPLTKYVFYGGQYMIKLAKELPKYTFALVVPDITDHKKLPNLDIPNLTFYPKLTFREVQKMYLKSKCFLRLTEHDGLSLSVLEALYYKLQVIWTYNFPYVTHIKKGNLHQLKEILINIMESYSPNTGGHNYVMQNYSSEKFKEGFLKLIKNLNKNGK
jgi:hypothetical protein